MCTAAVAHIHTAAATVAHIHTAAATATTVSHSCTSFNCKAIEYWLYNYITYSYSMHLFLACKDLIFCVAVIS